MTDRRSASARSATKRRAPKIRSGDHVRVIAGKDRGKSGRVLRVEPAKDRVYVEGMNMVKRHIRPKPTPQGSTYRGAEGQLGGVIESEGPIHISNVMLLDPKGKPTRVRIERESGTRVRVATSTGTRLD
jgi:large subunit ribosomal protein L24